MTADPRISAPAPQLLLPLRGGRIIQTQRRKESVSRRKPDNSYILPKKAGKLAGTEQKIPPSGRNEEILSEQLRV